MLVEFEQHGHNLEKLKPYEDFLIECSQKDYTKEQKEKWSIDRKGTQTDGNNPNSRPIMHCESGIVFTSRKEAMKYFWLSKYYFQKQKTSGKFADC